MIGERAVAAVVYDSQHDHLYESRRCSLIDLSLDDVIYDSIVMEICRDLSQTEINAERQVYRQLSLLKEIYYVIYVSVGIRA